MIKPHVADLIFYCCIGAVAGVLLAYFATAPN